MDAYFDILRDPKTAEISYQLSSEFWGREIATEALLHHYPYGREFHDVVMLAIVR